jgi:hypothetical protein
MKTLKTLALLALLGTVASPVQAQITESYTFTNNRVVPDGNAAGLSDVRALGSAIGTISSMKVRLKIVGEFNGDMYGYLRQENATSTNRCVIINRSGKTANNPYGYADSGFDVTFQDGAANGDVHVYQNVAKPADGSPLTGIWQPDGRRVDPAIITDLSPRSSALTNFISLNAAGTWTLFLADIESGGTNMLVTWGMDITGVANPTLTWPTPADIVYGTALGVTQLNATATHKGTNVPGTFAYSPASGTVLHAGLGQTISVTFTPTDLNSFLPITTNVLINVTTAQLTTTSLLRPNLILLPAAEVVPNAPNGQ